MSFETIKNYLINPRLEEFDIVVRELIKINHKEQDAVSLKILRQEYEDLFEEYELLKPFPRSSFISSIPSNETELISSNLSDESGAENVSIPVNISGAYNGNTLLGFFKNNIHSVFSLNENGQSNNVDERLEHCRKNPDKQARGQANKNISINYANKFKID